MEIWEMDMPNGLGASSRRQSTRCWTAELKVIAVLSVALLITGVGLAAFVSREFVSQYTFTPYAIYEYVVAIATNESEHFRVLCPFPCNSTGDVAENMLHSLHTTSNGETAILATIHGQALEISGSGTVLVTFSSHANLPGPWPGYLEYHHLSMTAGGWSGMNASVFSDGDSVNFGLQFRFSHVYGNLGADFIHYESSTTLADGWNTIQVDYGHAVA